MKRKTSARWTICALLGATGIVAACGADNDSRSPVGATGNSATAGQAADPDALSGEAGSTTPGRRWPMPAASTPEMRGQSAANDTSVNTGPSVTAGAGGDAVIAGGGGGQAASGAETGGTQQASGAPDGGNDGGVRTAGAGGLEAAGAGGTPEITCSPNAMTAETLDRCVRVLTCNALGNARVPGPCITSAVEIKVGDRVTVGARLNSVVAITIVLNSAADGDVLFNMAATPAGAVPRAILLPAGQMEVTFDYSASGPGVNQIVVVGLGAAGITANSVVTVLVVP